jgi:hypothetical protein
MILGLALCRYDQQREKTMIQVFKRGLRGN